MVYEAKNIRNVALFGHQGSGKTSLVESLYAAVNKTEKGSIEKGNTISDYQKEEKKRLSSISTSVVPLFYNDYKINLLDVPGNDDFVGEEIAVTHSVKGAILMIDASSGIQVGTIKAFKLLKRRGIPFLIYVNKMDKGYPNYEEILEQINKTFGKMCIPFTLPLGHADQFDGFINCVELKARKYNGKDCVDDVIYEDKKAKVFELYNSICEAVALTDDALLDKFFSGTPLTSEEIHKGLRKGVLNAEIYPIIFGSAINNIGINTLIRMLIDYLPAPDDLKPYSGIDDEGKEGEGFFMASVVDFGDINMYGTDISYYMIYNIMGITAVKDEMIDYKDILTNSLNTLEYKDSFVQKTIDDGNKETKRALALNAQMQAAYDSYNQAWENRQTSYDITSQKYSDATLGYERVYDTETGDIYKAYNGFTDDYSGSRYEPVTDNMYTEAVTGYIEK